MKPSWETRGLSEVAEVFDGPHATPKTVDSGPIFLGIGALQDGIINLGETRHVTEEDFKQWTRRVRPRPNDVVFSYETRLGQAAIIPEGLDCCLGRRMGLVRFKPGAVDPRFFLYQYLSPGFSRFLTSQIKRGATVDRISIKEFPSFPIAVPPLSEQRRIVTILDEAFEGIATAKANAEKNLQNAREVFVSELRSVFTQGGDRWVVKSLGQTCEMYQPKTIGSKDLVPDGPYPVFGANGIIGRYDKFNHEEPQLLITCRGATCGSVNVSEPNSWITGNAMVVRPKERSLDLRFLEYIFRGGIDISPAITGAAQPQITRTNLSPLEIGFPIDISEQERLVARFDQFTEETQRLIDLYWQKSDLLAGLKQSLLHRAFNGDL